MNHAIENSPHVGLQAIACVNGLKLKVTVLSESFSYGKTRFECQHDAGVITVPYHDLVFESDFTK